jgi:hypothetical protein
MVHPRRDVALLVRYPDESRTLQRIIRVTDLRRRNYLGWLAFENCRGGNVYFSINPLAQNAARRTKDAVAEAKALYLDLDLDGDAKLAAIRHSESVPVPSAVIQTSTGKYQLLWRVCEFSTSGQEAMLKTLAETLGGDRACTDCSRVFRLPGFFNRKYIPAVLVTAEIRDVKTVYTPSDFRLEKPSVGNVLQRLEASRTFVVIFEEKAIDGQLVEQSLCNRFIAPLSVPVASIVSAAKMDCQRNP